VQIVKSSKPVGGPDYVATSALKGNRLEQADEVRKECLATDNTLVPQFQIATDGLTLTKIQALKGESAPGVEGSNYLQPGYRSDVLVVFPSDGHYCLQRRFRSAFRQGRTALTAVGLDRQRRSCLPISTWKAARS
jgi:hypothetical protein